MDSNAICVHVRRGDYVVRGACSPAYFARAVNEILARTGWKRATAFVFSDDMEWCRSSLRFDPPAGVDLRVDYVDINDSDAPVFEMELMRGCRHYVLSTGGFGYMASVLSVSKEESIVIWPDENRADDWCLEWSSRTQPASASPPPRVILYQPR
ncbi:MAG: alpha-1,2-fucosyltransferase [Synergistaceae bacterium]|jgi:hypothetical protein|nr:alpha-1,2-fucosyltransferase [Synergistaceae bacterium]